MKKKKTIRNILIAVVALVVIAAVIFLSIAFQKDGHGMNMFQRAKTAASVDGIKVNMIEYALTFDMLLSNNSITASSLSDDQLKMYQESAAKQALMIDIYAREAKALGLNLTDEEKQACKDSAQEQIDDIAESYTQSLISNGNYSKAALNKQLASYYNQLGLNQSQYYNYVKERVEATYYQSKLSAYYEQNGSGFTEEEILEYYHNSVAETMDGYSEGMYSLYTQFYAMGYSTPMLFVPEGFIYVDFVELSKDTEEEINEILAKLESGEMTFEELMESEDNKDLYKGTLQGPYAIGEQDYSYVCGEEDFFTKAAALEIGEIDSIIVPVTGTAEEGQEAPITGYTGYLFRRAVGTMCENGDSGVIKIDWYDGMRESAIDALREKQWLGNTVINDGVYAYKGVS